MTQRPNRRLTAARVNATLSEHTQRSAVGIANTLTAWGERHVEPVKRRANVAVALAVLALVLAVVGVVV